MASKYAKPLQVPVEFPDLLRTFTREVLRQQGKLETKEAIYEFGTQFFSDLVAKREGGGAKATAASGVASIVPMYMKLSEDEIQDILLRAFHDADPQNAGMLAYNAFHQLLCQVDEHLQLSSVELKAFFAEVSENDEGLVSYADFLPVALQMILHLRATKPQRQARIDMFAKKDTEIFLHGMMQDEIESLLREILQRADAEGHGVLGRLEFVDALLDADLGLTRREVNILLSETLAFLDDSAEVAYLDFIPVVFPVLRDVFVQGVVELPNDQDSLTQYLVKVFASGDTEATGLLTVAELTRLFRAADIGLTRLQIITVLSEAQEDKSGFVNYEKFAAHVAGMVVVLVSFDSQQTFAAYLQKYRKTSEYYTVLDMNQHTFEQSLARALEALDEGHRGILPREDVLSAIHNTFSDISQRQMRALMALADVDEMGELECTLITHSAFQALQKLQEYDMMIMES
uniref:Calmodulin n=1 Tax=Globisporangium ultimum (strain ATCC 200006 / CBS 805.95 / DAOM BR144) TaxID=431595 RepID=K3WK59_GLOUD